MPIDRRLAYHRLAFCLLLTMPLAACGEEATVARGEDFGPAPKLVEPKSSLIPTINVAPVSRWPDGAKPKTAEGLSVAVFAGSLDHPRALYVLPNGDVLVAETNAPPKPEDGKGVRGFVQKLFQKRAGAVTPSANRITL
jgi:hypothetical protein